jgi:hypothetical protein
MTRGHRLRRNRPVGGCGWNPGSTCRRRSTTGTAGSPPAKLLERLYRERRRETYRKTTHTADLPTKLPTTPGAQAEGMTAKRPYLRGLLDELVSPASAA